MPLSFSAMRNCVTAKFFPMDDTVLAEHFWPSCWPCCKTATLDTFAVGNDWRHMISISIGLPKQLITQFLQRVERLTIIPLHVCERKQYRTTNAVENSTFN